MNVSIHWLRLAVCCSLWLAMSSWSQGEEIGSRESLAGTWMTSDGYPKRGPTFLPGGDELVFAQESPKTAGMQLMRLNLETSQVERYSKDHPDGDREFSVSADGQVYAYNVVRGLSSKLHIVDRRVDKQIKLPQLGRHSWSNWPAVSPDGNRVAFVEGAQVLYEYDVVANLGKASVRRLSPQGKLYSDYWPQYSPDGRHIVFCSNRDGDFELYLMNADGTGQRRIHESPGIDMHPAFSPDGKQIAFTSNRDLNHEIYVFTLATGEARRITFNPERDDFACWFPDGTELVIVSEHNGEFDLRRVSTEPRQR